MERPAALPEPVGDDAEPVEIRSGSVPVDLDRTPDAWDDEWRDAAFRLPSIPAAMDIAPAQVDAWLEGQARDLDDVTRSTAARWSDDPRVLRSARGSTWDDDTGPTPEPELADQPEATDNQPEATDDTETVGVPEGQVVVDITATETRTATPDETPDETIAAAIPAAIPAAVPESPVGATAGPTTAHPWRAEGTPDPLEQTVARPIRTTGPVDPPGRRRDDRPGPQRDERVVVVRADDAPGSSWDDDVDLDPVPGDARSRPTDDVGTDLDTDLTTDSDLGPDSELGPDSDLDTDLDADWSDDFDDTGTLGLPLEPERRRRVAARFQPEDRSGPPRDLREGAEDLVGGRTVAHFVQVAVTAGWLAALVAGARAVVAIGAAANRPDDGIGAWQRIGSELGQLGTTQGLLLVVAVVLLGMSALGGPRIVERSEARSSSGLGVVGAAAVIGIASGVLAFFAARDLGAPTADALVDLVGSVGLSFAALLTALVSLRARRLA